MHELARKAVSKVVAKTMDEALIKTVVYVLNGVDDVILKSHWT